MLISHVSHACLLYLLIFGLFDDAFKLLRFYRVGLCLVKNGLTRMRRRRRLVRSVCVTRSVVLPQWCLYRLIVGVAHDSSALMMERGYSSVTFLLIDQTWKVLHVWRPHRPHRTSQTNGCKYDPTVWWQLATGFQIWGFMKINQKCND